MEITITPEQLARITGAIGLLRGVGLAAAEAESLLEGDIVTASDVLFETFIPEGYAPEGEVPTEEQPVA